MTKSADVQATAEAASWVLETGMVFATSSRCWAEASDQTPQRSFASFFTTCLAGEGGGCFQALTWHWALKVYTLCARIREGAIIPSGSSKARTRELLKPGVKRDGQRTQDGSWHTFRLCKEGLLSISTCQQVGGECAWGCPSTTPVGMELISTLPYLTLRQEDIVG